MSVLTRRFREVRATDDAGVSLTELLVTMGLSTIIGALTLTMFIGTSNATQDTTDRTLGSSQARTVLQAWTSYLRVADGPVAGSPANRIEWLTSTDLVFHADLGNRSTTNPGTARGTTDLVWLRLYDGQLVEERLSGTTTTCRILADEVTTTTLFSGWDRTGAAVTTTDSGSPTTASRACATMPSAFPHTDPNAIAALQNVTTVLIDFSVTDSRRVHTQEYSSFGFLPVISATS